MIQSIFIDHCSIKGVLAVDIKDFVYTEPGGNVTLNCSNKGGIMQWMLKSRQADRYLTISTNQEISVHIPEFQYHYKVTNGAMYNLQIENSTNFTEGEYGCFANCTPDCIHYFYLLLKGKYIWFHLIQG